jgi:hypothetical protein
MDVGTNVWEFWNHWEPINRKSATRFPGSKPWPPTSSASSWMRPAQSKSGMCTDWSLKSSWIAIRRNFRSARRNRGGGLCRSPRRGCSYFCTRMARPKRFELLTPRFVVWCSIQLSYGRILRARTYSGASPKASSAPALCVPNLCRTETLPRHDPDSGQVPVKTCRFPPKRQCAPLFPPALLGKTCRKGPYALAGTAGVGFWRQIS